MRRKLHPLCFGLICVFAAGETAAAPAPRRCKAVSAHGTGATAQVAKFQVYEGLLHKTDAGLWATWMADGVTPGYAIKRVKYVCDSGTGLGITCSGSATICKR